MVSKRRLKAKDIRNIEGSLFIAPWLIGFLAFVAFPLGYSFYMSFNDVKVQATGIRMVFRGLEHYKYILFTNGGVLYEYLIPFLLESMLVIPTIIIFALLVAILLNQKFRGRGIFRAIFFLPVIFSTGQVVTEFITQGEGDLGFLDRYNIESFVTDAIPGGLSAPLLALLNSFVIVLWYSGVQVVLFLAGRQTISSSIYEAARIDGANPWESFWKITLPGMTPFILLNLIYTIVDLFTFPTNPVISQVTSTDYGRSSALAWIYFTIILLFLGIVFFVFSRLSRAEK
ncbi:carbohydrate ABC transporter permease [Paenibacillus nasutitermitis]|uniref:ABC transporter permease n=1 Tax=Paenibacillus nasutitermitis TaxID=1652958 RepID=A0A916Z7E7_9BACL|nr:sugar ABC transporter permease [Paenibacillus nasutitermitis]GGD79804.1 ABC transporter permease [Paenibacillus nasutitermitis]